MDFYLDGNLVPAPENWKTLMLELSFENTNPLDVLNTNQLVWKGSNAKILNTWFSQSKIFQGVPLVIKICSTGEVAFNGIVDLTDPSTLWNCDIVKVKIRDRRMDMVTQLFDSIGFDYLSSLPAGSPGKITPKPISAGGDYVVVPYQIDHLPDYIQVFTLGLTIYNIAEKIKDVVHKLVSHITALVSSPGIGAFVLNMLLILGYLLYLIAMILVLIQLLIAAVDNIISPVYTKLGMYVTTLIQKACDYFGIGFSSSWLSIGPFNKMFLLPAKPSWPVNNTFTVNLFNSFLGGSGSHNRRQYDDTYNLTQGGMAYGYADGTIGDLMRALSVTFNLKGRVINDAQGNPVLHLERWDYVNRVANYTMPNISQDAPFKQPFATNASEIASNYEVVWARDSEDANTYDNYQGTRCMVNTRVTNYADVQQLTLKNLVSKNIPFSHVTRKDRDTTAEELLAPAWALFSIIANPVINFVNNINQYLTFMHNHGFPNLPAPPPIPHIPAHPAWSFTGHMLLTSHTTGVPKLGIAGAKTSNTFYGYDGVQISPTNRATNQPSLAASMLVKYFHFSNLGLTVNPGAPYTIEAAGTTYFNQYYVYKNQKIPVCCADYSEIKNANIIKTFDGQQARVDSMAWTTFAGTAMANYRIKKQFTNNLSVTYIVDGAQILSSL